MSKFKYSFRSILALAFFMLAPMAHADVVYTRTPSGPTVTNPVTVRVQGVFGADFCDTSHTFYLIYIQSGSNQYFGNGGYGNHHSTGDIVDDSFSFGTLPTGGYSKVVILCSDPNLGYTSTIILEQGNPAFSVFAIGPSIFQQAVLGQPFTLQLGASGGPTPYTWSLTTGALPSGLSLNSSTGLISGTPTASGSFPITVQLQDATGGIVTKDYSLTVTDGPAFTYTRTPSGPSATNPVTVRVRGVFGANMCDTSHTYYLIYIQSGSNLYFGNGGSGVRHSTGDGFDDSYGFGTLPTGGYSKVVVLCGDPQLGYTSTIILEQGNPAFSVTDLSITPSVFQQAVLNQPYSLALHASGGAAPYSWSLVSGTLPSGLSFNTSTGLISGTPTVSGSFPITIQIQDAVGGIVTKNYSLSVTDGLAFTYTRTPSGTTATNPLTVRVQGVFGANMCDTSHTYYLLYIQSGSNLYFGNGGYGVRHSAGDGFDDSYGFGTLPTGGYSKAVVICGDPQLGYTSTIILEQGNPAFTITDLAIGPSVFQQAVLNQQYSLQLQASGGMAPYSWSLTGGVMPSGISFNTSTGLISGTPTVLGSFPITVQIQDATGAKVTKDYPLQVFPPIVITTSSLPSVLLNASYSQELTGFGGQTPYSWSIVSGSLPDGLSLDNSTGVISGTATITGTFNFTVQINDSNSHSNTKALSIVVQSPNNAPILTPIGNKTTDEGRALTFVVSATDPDNDTLTYSATNLPAGSTFDPLTHIFTWTPSFTQEGNYPNVEFTVMDNGSPMMLAFEDITITVGNVNRAPIFALVGSQQVLEHNLLTFTVSATDLDGNSVTLSVSGMPSGATFDPATGVFSWTPVYPQAGVYTPTFTATDNGSPLASSAMDVVITVGSNPTPTEQAQALVDTVVVANLPGNVENSYLANLNKVGTFIEQGNVQAAINQLNAFINKVNQDYTQSIITLAEKNYFVALAQNLINALQ